MFDAKIIVPVSIAIEVDASAFVFSWGAYDTGATLSVDGIRVKSINGLPQGVSEYVGKGINLALRATKGLMRFRLTSIK